MRTFSRPLLGLALALSATPAMAQDAEAPAVTVSGSVAVVSDYRFRGITQTDKDFAVQAGVTVSHESGLYAGVWGSSVDEYIAAGSDQEIDLIVGYKKTFGATTLDVGGLYYYYPGSSKITPGTNSDFLELYTSLSQTIGPVSAKLAAFYSPKQAALSLGKGNLDNVYVNFGLSGAIPNTPVSLSAGIGRTFTKSYLSGGSKYTDWSVGASYTLGKFTLGLNYVDTSYAAGALLSPSGRDIAKGGLFGSVGVSF